LRCEFFLDAREEIPMKRKSHSIEETIRIFIPDATENTRKTGVFESPEIAYGHKEEK
jgi:hypothetical protein